MWARLCVRHDDTPHACTWYLVQTVGVCRPASPPLNCASLQDAVHALVRLRDDGLPLDLSDVILLGHSAGGTLVLWLAAQPLAVRVRLVVAVAPVADLVQGCRP